MITLKEAVKTGQIQTVNDIDVVHGPPGGYGFRTGNWIVNVDGVECKVYLSVPHAIPLSEQHDTVCSAVRSEIARYMGD